MAAASVACDATELGLHVPSLDAFCDVQCAAPPATFSTRVLRAALSRSWMMALRSAAAWALAAALKWQEASFQKKTAEEEAKEEATKEEAKEEAKDEAKEEAKEEAKTEAEDENEAKHEVGAGDGQNHSGEGDMHSEDFKELEENACEDTRPQLSTHVQVNTADMTLNVLPSCRSKVLKIGRAHV